MTKRRILSMLLAFAMVIGMLPATALAVDGSYEVGDIAFTDDRNTQPTGTIPAGTEWVYEGLQYACGLQEHTHSSRNGCYSYTRTCDGNHVWHSSDCYEWLLTCETEEHSHSDACGRAYAWILEETSNSAQYREWWPVYWDFDSRSSVRDSGVVTVTAAGSGVAHSSGEVLSRDSLSDNTADTGDVLSGGFQITAAPGYYVTRYRLVCGNHTDCGVTGYNQGITTGNTEGNYSSTITYRPSESDFNHWYNIGGMHNNPSGRSGVYQPTTKPDASDTNIYHTHSSNTIYPFYLLVEVAKDNASYNITYDWGSLKGTLTSTVPGLGEYNNLPRNTNHTVLAPGAGETEAANLGYQFLGWKVESAGYADNIVVDPGNTVSINGANIRLVAQWAPAVTWRYVGDVPAGATTLPATTNYAEGAAVPVVNVIAPAGYKFNGWTEVTNNNVNLSGDSFAMPASPVVIQGSFSEDRDQLKTIGYTVRYWFNGQQNQELATDIPVTDTVWVNAPDTLNFDNRLKKDFAGWTFSSSNPVNLALPIRNGSYVDLYYVGANHSLDLDKSVLKNGVSAEGQTVQVGDVLTYKISVYNHGNVAMTNVVVTDSPNGAGNIVFDAGKNPGVTHSTVSDSGVEMDVFTIASLPVGETVVIEYTYTVVTADAGSTLINNAFWNDNDEDDADTTVVNVEEQPTLTVEYYINGVKDNTYSKSYSFNKGAAWSVVTNGSSYQWNDAVHTAPKSLTVGNTTYAFDDPATTDAPASGTLNGDVTVKLYYATDEIGTNNPDDPDNIPDKYQATILYTTTTGGGIASGWLEKEVVNVYAPGTQNLATQGVITARGSKAEVKDDRYQFANLWTMNRQGHTAYNTSRTTLELGAYQLPPVGYENNTAMQAIAGSTYIFTAIFEKKPVPGLFIEKRVGFTPEMTVPVGTQVEYIIHVQNTGGVELENVVINDIMSYDPNCASDIPGYRSYIQELRVTGTEADNYTIAGSLSSITIKKLAINQPISVQYVYVVQPADAEKSIYNLAEAETTYNGEEIAVQDTAQINIGEYKSVLSVDKALTSVNGNDVPAGYKANTGDKLVWTITVTNTGNADAWIDAPVDTLSVGSQHTEKTLQVTAAADVVKNDAGKYKVSAGGSAVFTTEEYTVISDALSGILHNTATIEGGISDREDTPTADPFADLTVKKELTGVILKGETAQIAPSYKVNVGDTLVWTITVTNDGNYHGEITINDVLKYGDLTEVGSLELTPITEGVTKNNNGSYAVPTTGIAFTTSYTVQEKDVGKTLRNTVVVNDGTTDEVVPTDPVVVTGYKVTYEYRGDVPAGLNAPVDNTEYANGANVTTKTVPTVSGYAFDGWTIDGNTNKWTPGSVYNGITGDITLIGTWTKLEANISKVEKTLYSVNDKEVDPTASAPTVKPGDTLVWNIVVTNSGNIDGWVPKPVDTLNGTIHLNVVPAAGLETKVVNGVTMYKVPANNGTALFTASYTVPADTAFPNGLINKVAVENETDTDDKIPVKALDVTKVVQGISRNIDGAIKVHPGETINWIITVKNTGSVALEKISLTDTLSGVDSVAVVKEYGADTALDLTSYTFALEVGQTKSFTASYTTGNDDAGKTINNVAVAAVEDIEDKDTPDTPIIVTTPGLEVTKTLKSDKNVKVGDTITWEIVITNTGNTELTNITLTDTLSGVGVANAQVDLDEACPSTLAVGASVTLTATYVVKPADAGKTINNTAVATSGNITDQDTPEDPVKVHGYKVTYEYTGALAGALTPPTDNREYAYEATVTTKLPHSEIGYEFTGWTVKDSDPAIIVDPGKTFAITGDTTLVGNWTKLEPNISAIDKILYSVNGTRVDKAPEYVKVGDTLVWNIVVTNSGRYEGWVEAPADTLNDNIKLDVAPVSLQHKIEGGKTLYRVPAGGTALFRAVYTVQEGVEYPYGLINGVTLENLTDTESKIPVKALDVTKVVTGKTTVNPGETISWTITVKNTGSENLSGIKLSDTLTHGTDTLGSAVITKDGSAFDLANATFDLAAGDTVTFLAEYITSEADAGKRINNTAVATVGDITDEDTPKEPVTVTNPNLQVTKELPADAPKSVKVGDTITWNIVVTNTGDVTLENIKLTDTVTLTAEDGTTQTATATLTGDAITDNTIASLVPGEAHAVTVIATYEVKADDAGKKITNAVIAGNDDTEAEGEEDEPVTVKNPGLTVTKTPNTTSAAAGETITWTIVVENTGNVKLTDITVTDTLSGTADANAKVTLSETEPFDLEPGAKKSLTATYEVKAADVGKKISNSVVVEGKDPTDPDTPVKDEDKSEDVTVKNPGLTVTKIADRSIAWAGETINWTVRIANSGNTDLTNISVVDTLYANGRPVASLTLKDAAGNTVSTIASLKAGETVVLYASYRVTPADEGWTLRNVAVATTPGNGPSDEGQSGNTGIPVSYTPPVVKPVTPPTPTLNLKDHVAYIIGYTDGTVQPQKNITRAEVATIFFRLLTDESRAYYWSQTNSYSDVKATDWFNNAISTLSNAGIITGYTDGTFKPNAPITRAEFATIAARFSDVVYNGGHNFIDVPSTHWANRYIALAEHLGWITGYPDSTFRPDRDITRAEAMTLINRVLEREVEEEHLLHDMVHWIDNTPDKWYYEAVQEATNSHTYTRLNKLVPGQDFCYEDWMAILPVPDWAALEKSWSNTNMK